MSEEVCKTFDFARIDRANVYDPPMQSTYNYDAEPELANRDEIVETRDNDTLAPTTDPRMGTKNCALSRHALIDSSPCVGGFPEHEGALDIIDSRHDTAIFSKCRHDDADRRPRGNSDLNNEKATDFGRLIVAEEESTDGDTWMHFES